MIHEAAHFQGMDRQIAGEAPVASLAETYKDSI